MPIVAWDADVGQSVTFSIIESQFSHCFYIDKKTGQISVLDETCFNYENIRFDTWTSSSESVVKSVSELDENTFCIVDKITFPAQNLQEMDIRDPFASIPD